MKLEDGCEYDFYEDVELLKNAEGIYDISITTDFTYDNTYMNRVEREFVERCVEKEQKGEELTEEEEDRCIKAINNSFKKADRDIELEYIIEYCGPGGGWPYGKLCYKKIDIQDFLDEWYGVCGTFTIENVYE